MRRLLSPVQWSAKWHTDKRYKSISIFSQILRIIARCQSAASFFSCRICLQLYVKRQTQQSAAWWIFIRICTKRLTLPKHHFDAHTGSNVLWFLAELLQKVRSAAEAAETRLRKPGNWLCVCNSNSLLFIVCGKGIFFHYFWFLQKSSK